jgi:phosphopantothenoylcysteine decarboxylase/phosphopantothenate--cysteine ligase
MMTGKKILLGVTGGIAAYKIPQLVRLLSKQGASVKVIMTPDAVHFVTPLTLSTVSNYPVFIDFFNPRNGEWNNHVELAAWADVFVIAPATAHSISKMANGQADNLLMATYLSAKCPVMIAPAMDLDMYAHFSTVENLEKLANNGHHIIPAASGPLASGLIGEGRMQEPEYIVDELKRFFEKGKSFSGKKIIVTAGPTYEAIDPVRFIGNHSSGKMGIRIAEELAFRGADVILICGPSAIKHQQSNIKRVNITSADEMFSAVKQHFEYTDAVIMSAAVADYKPVSVSSSKMKKNDDELTIQLTKNPDILAWMGMHKKHQILAGFALETDNELQHAKDKLIKKNLDFIVLNSLQHKGAGFQHDTNQISIIEKDEKMTHFEIKSKKEVAVDVADKLFLYLQS